MYAYKMYVYQMHACKMHVSQRRARQKGKKISVFKQDSKVCNTRLDKPIKANKPSMKQVRCLLARSKQVKSMSPIKQASQA